MKKLVITSLLALPLILTSCSNKDENVKEYKKICKEFKKTFKGGSVAQKYYAVGEFAKKLDAFDKKLYEEIQVPKLEELYRKGLVDKKPVEGGGFIYVDKSNELNEKFQNDPQFREEFLKALEEYGESLK